MDGQTSGHAFPTRELIAKTRAGLDAAGHQDVRVDGLWIDEDRSAPSPTLDVPIGADMVLPLEPLTDGTAPPSVVVDEFARHLVQALPNVLRAGPSLRRYAAAVRRAAVREIEAARADGLELLLESVTLRPTSAWLLTGADWRSAADHVLAEVRVRRLSFHLRQEVIAVVVGEPKEVTKELAPIREQQGERQRRAAELAALGADLEVDGITLDLLRVAGLPLVELLRRARSEQCVNVAADHQEGAAGLALLNSDGRVTASMRQDGLFWNGERMWGPFRVEPERIPGLIGAEASTLVAHPAFASARIVSIAGDEHPEMDVIRFETPMHLFDASSGRVWPSGRSSG